MHELAVCQGLMTQVEIVAAREKALRVLSITLQIGPLSGVEAELLRDAFPIASAGSVAEGAELNIETMPVRVRCLSCGAETDARVNRLVCGECGDFRTQLISGEEMLLKSLELEREEEPVPASLH
ncbi:MAG: hydrogenase maturation nickel metallochaperone HypA [Gammaproteobacteria bacterium]